MGEKFSFTTLDGTPIVWGCKVSAVRPWSFASQNWLNTSSCATPDGTLIIWGTIALKLVKSWFTQKSERFTTILILRPIPNDLKITILPIVPHTINVPTSIAHDNVLNQYCEARDQAQLRSLCRASTCYLHHPTRFKSPLLPIVPPKINVPPSTTHDHVFYRLYETKDKATSILTCRAPSELTD